ncbi:MAG TPA: hypothetical protein GXX29_10715 [Firmicutes bacterium]|nr:hypothetical protein [Bacillota bacterium]
MAIMQVKDNVEAEKPTRGTVVATITDEEAASLREIVILYDAIRMTHITLTLAKELAEKKATWWETICVKYGLPHTWPLAADYVEKVIYIGE